MAVLQPILNFGHVIDGVTHRRVVKFTSRLLNEDYASRQATYDLRRLRWKELISRLAQATIPINSEGEDGRSIVHQDVPLSSCA